MLLLKLVCVVVKGGNEMMLGLDGGRRRVVVKIEFVVGMVFGLLLYMLKVFMKILFEMY